MKNKKNPYKNQAPNEAKGDRMHGIGKLKNNMIFPWFCLRI